MSRARLYRCIEWIYIIRRCHYQYERRLCRQLHGVCVRRRWTGSWGGDRMETGFSGYLDRETTYLRRVVCHSLNGRKCVRDDFEVRDFFDELLPFQLDAYCIEDCTLTGIPFRPEGLGNAMMRVSEIPSVVSCRPVSGCPGNKRVRTRIHDLPP